MDKLCNLLGGPTAAEKYAQPKHDPLLVTSAAVPGMLDVLECKTLIGVQPLRPTQKTV